MSNLLKVRVFCLAFMCFQLSFCFVEGRSFNGKSLYLLDRQGKNYLLRGGLPEEEGEFCYETLKSEIKNYLEQQGELISDNFRLICVSLLNSFADGKECRRQEKVLKMHRESDYLWRYPLFGYVCSPDGIPQNLRTLFYRTDPDGLRFFLCGLKKLLDFDYGCDAVIYMHCRAGKDRTGEASACYLMQYKRASYQDAMALNEKIAKRPLRTMSVNAVRWHACYLKEVCGLPFVKDVK